MKKHHLIVLVFVVCVGTAGVLFLIYPSSGKVRPSSVSGGVYTGPPLTDSYTNERFRFKLTLPESFTAGELPPDEAGGTAVVLQNERGEGIQIYIVPAEESSKVLTADDIRDALPDIKIEQVETVEIGNEYRGVAFVSNNEAFEGMSREVWFYFKGNLYQISTYARLDTLLKALFATWEFY